MRYLLIIVFLLGLVEVHIVAQGTGQSQQIGYLNWLREYWNYRYHLVGDGTIKTQHFPSDCNFMEPSGIGEPGLIIVGTGAPGLSLIADHIATYKQIGPLQ